MLLKDSSLHVFSKLQKILKPNSTIEVGASGAEFSIDMLNTLNHTNIWAIEANTYIYQTNKEKEEIKNNSVKYDNLLISDHAGVDIFNYQGAAENNSYETNSILWKKTGAVGTKTPVSVPCSTLDDYVKLRNIPAPHSVWVDVEGANKHVLIGATETLKNTLSIHIEVETKEIWEGQWLDVDVSLFLDSLDFVRFGGEQRGNYQLDSIYIKKELMSESLKQTIIE